MTPGTRISIGRSHIQGTLLRIRGPLAQVALDNSHKTKHFLLSSCKEIPGK